MRQRQHHRRGFLMLDIIFGLAVLSVVFSGLFASAALLGKGQRTMADRRYALRTAELVLTNLQTGADEPIPANVELQMQETGGPENAGSSTGPMVWCEVRVNQGELQVSLTGFVPRAAFRKAATHE